MISNVVTESRCKTDLGDIDMMQEKALYGKSSFFVSKLSSKYQTDVSKTSAC